MVYITVRFGEGQREIFNPNCKTYLLLKTIKHKCKCDREADIELSDESGNIKNLRDPGLQHKYANEFLDERENLVLLKVERTHGETHVGYLPLLNENDALLSDDFMARLKGCEQAIDHRRVKSNTRRREKHASESKEQKEQTPSRQSSRERAGDKLKPGSKSDKRLSARSKR